MHFLEKKSSKEKWDKFVEKLLDFSFVPLSIINGRPCSVQFPLEFLEIHGISNSLLKKHLTICLADCRLYI